MASEGQGRTYNGVTTHISSRTELGDMDILNSRNETRRGLWGPYQDKFRDLVSIGSVAYKLGLVAAGKHDMFATLRPKNEWDVCAGDCLLREAGGELRNLGGVIMTYNKAEVTTRPGLVWGNP